MRLLVVAVTLLWTVAAAYAADPTGSYEVQGKNPDGSTYEGTATVTKTGDTFKVIWEVGSEKYTGTAIGNKDFLAISYTSGNNQTGLALYGADGGNWKGVWTYAGGTTMGAELWKRE
jgi:hypothetical protein